MFLFYLSEAVKSLSRAKFASFVLILTTCIAIALTSFSLALFLVSNKIESKLKSRVELSLFLADSISQNQIKSIKKNLNSKVYTHSLKFVSKEEAKEKFIKETGEDFSSILELNPLPASFHLRLKANSFSAENIDSIINELKNTPGVNDIIYDYDLILKLLAYINSVKLIIYAASIILILLTLYFYYALNTFIIKTREKQITTMKLVGAKLFAIRAPIFIASIIIGLFASIVCSVVYFAFVYIVSHMYSIEQYMELIYLNNLAILLLGLLFGILGGYLSNRKVSLKLEKR